MTSNRFTGHELLFLKALCDPACRAKILRSLSDEQLKYLRNIAYNLVNDNFEVSACAKKKLGKYKKHFRALADVKKKRVKRQAELAGKGFGILAPLLISLASSLGGKLFERAVGV
jgi:hypothetical protein